jgi:hypothetical protein
MPSTVNFRAGVSALIAAALLGPSSVNADPPKFVSGPSVSSPTPRRYTVIARAIDNQFYALDKTLVQVPERPYWYTPGWSAIPGAADLNSDPDSTVDLYSQFVVGRRGDNACWAIKRGLPTGSGASTQFPAWSPWMFCGGAFHSGLSVAADNHPESGYSVLYVFGRGTDDGIQQMTATDTATGIVSSTPWAPIPGGLYGFDSDPDATAYDTPSGHRVAVCAGRAGVLWCNTYDVGASAWSGWIVVGQSRAAVGPALTAGVDPNGYDVFYPTTSGGLGSAIGFLQWAGGGWRWDVTQPPAVAATSDPDATVWLDGALPRRLVCVRDPVSLIQCSISYETTWSSWFAPHVAAIAPPAAWVTASTNDGNVPANTVDNNLVTRWSGNGDGAWLQADFGAVRRLAYAAIAFYKGSSRQYQFELQVATEPGVWRRVQRNGVYVKLTSSGTTTAEETFDFDDVDARWVRYVGHGNNETYLGTWNGITEIEFWGR